MAGEAQKHARSGRVRSRNGWYDTVLHTNTKSLPHLPFWSLADANNSAFRADAGSESVRSMRDGARPRCRNCHVRGDECRWGLKVSFHPSRTLELDPDERAALLAIEEGRSAAAQASSTSPVIIEHAYQAASDAGADAAPTPTECNASSAPDGSESRTVDESHTNVHADINTVIAISHLTPPEAPAVGETPGTQQRNPLDADGFQTYAAPTDSSTAPYRDAPFQAASYWGTDAHGISPASDGGYGAGVPSDPSLVAQILPFSLGQGVSLNSSPSPELELPLGKAEQGLLISAYLRETGTWCETTDSARHFTIASVHAMMESPAFCVAAMALASRQLDSVRRRQRQTTLLLYQHSIRVLIHQAPSQADATVLATCTLLCVYEMMASDVSEWRRHLKGCAGLLMSRNWNGSSQGIVNSCFWAFARIDIWAAFIVGEKTLMPTEFWVDEDLVEPVAAKGELDAYCNLAILIFAKIINLLADYKYRAGASASDAETINSLWAQLQAWSDHRIMESLPLFRGAKSKQSPFETIIFTQPSSICGNTFYHTGSILLLRTGQVWPRAPETDSDTMSMIWHAQELCGISVSNASHANWVNHLQPLYIAGEVFGRSSSISTNSPGGHESVISAAGDDAISEEEHVAEKIALLKHLGKIERETGWKTSGRAAQLRTLWGIG